MDDVVRTSQGPRTRLMVTVLGDSISAGFGLPAAAALPRRLAVRLDAEGWRVDVVGAGVSGDATADGLRRLDRSVPAKTDLCVVALGANDLMQSVRPNQIQHNLDQIVTRLQARGVAVLLCGMRAPPWIQPYAATFDRVFPTVARAHGVPLYPFLLDGVALNPVLNLADRIHPNAAGVEVIADGLTPWIVRALETIVQPSSGQS